MAGRRRLIRVYLHPDDEGLYLALEKIVKAKNATGFKSSISFELVRLAKNGLLGNLVGAKVDREILLGKKP